MIQTVKKTSATTINVHSVLSSLKRVAPSLCDGRQHDAHELFVGLGGGADGKSFILQALGEEIEKKQVSDPPVENMFITNGNQREAKLVLRFRSWWEHYRRHNPQPITDLFYGYTITSCSCPSCASTTYSMSSFNTIYTSLVPTHLRFTVNLVFQHWSGNTESLRISLVTREVVLPPGATIGDLQSRIDSAYPAKQIHSHCILYSEISCNESVCAVFLPDAQYRPISPDRLVTSLPQPSSLLLYIVFSPRPDHSQTPLSSPTPFLLASPAHSFLLLTAPLPSSLRWKILQSPPVFLTKAKEGDARDLLEDALFRCDSERVSPMAVSGESETLSLPIEHPSFALLRWRPALQPNYSLQTGIANDLVGENDSICGTCGHSHRFQFTTRFGRLPPIMAVNLKRFADGSGRKMNDFVQYPLRELELKSDDGAIVYDLMSVVCHHGFAESGHYTCFCRYESRWFLMNDEIVTPVREKEAVNSHAYLLFYRRREEVELSSMYHFMNYAPAPSVGALPGNKRIQDIQGYKNITSIDSSKQMMMKEFQSSLWGASKKREASVPIPSEDQEVEDGESEEDEEAAHLMKLVSGT